MMPKKNQKRCQALLLLLSIPLLLACSPKKVSRTGKQLLSIEKDRDLQTQSLSPEDEKRLKELQQDLEKISGEMQQQIILRTRYVDANRAAALIFFNYGMYSDALPYFNRAIDTESSNSSLFYYRALTQALLMKSQTDEKTRIRYLENAERDYQRAVEIRPGNTDALYGLAVLQLFERENFAEAAETLDRYLAVREVSKQQVPDKPIRNLREAQERAKEVHSSNDIRVLFMRAQAAYALGDTDGAAGFYDWILNISRDPDKRQEAEKLKRKVLSPR